MPVDTTHPQYDKMLTRWERMRHVIEGEDAVKEQGKRYLPPLGGQDDDSYRAYLMRAEFYNASGRTVDGLSGMVFRKDPQFMVPPAMEAFEKDITLTGLNLKAFSEQVVEEILVEGRYGILVEYPRVSLAGKTRLQVERLNLRPFLIPYKTEQIINWKTGIVGNQTKLTQVRLMESVVEEGEDEFSPDEVDQIRVLDLARYPAAEGKEDFELIPSDLYYRQRVFRKDKARNEWAQYGEDIVPLMSNKPLEDIPFVFFSPRDTTPDVQKPPLIDLANVNLSHFRTSADLEHGAHFAALPTPYCFGVSDNPPDSIGPENLWWSPDENVTVGMLEFTGAGLEPLEKRLEKKENQMAALGARMLAPEKKAAEAAETAAIHRQGEISVLASLASAVSLGLTKCMEIARDWMQLGGEAWVELNKDFIPVPMTPQQMTALFQVVQAGRMSQKVFFENLQRGEIISADKSFEDEELDRADDFARAEEARMMDDTGDDETQSPGGSGEE